MRGCLVLLALSAPALAQQVVAPGTATRGAIIAAKDGLTLPAGEFTVAELIEAVAVYLCRNYLYDQAVVDGARGFTLQRSVALDALGSEEMLYALLSARNLAAVPLDELRGVFQIIALGTNPPQPGPIAAIPWRSPEEILQRPRLRELVMTAVDLKQVDAQQIAQALRNHFSMLGQWQPGVMTACASGRHTLLLHGYRDQLAQTILLMRQLDKLQADEPPVSAEVRQRLDALEREVAALRAELKANAPSAELKSRSPDSRSQDKPPARR
ncbi:MAG TPA: hypothetical protein VFD82_13830 [Planctomycetota bacterium]|nr:hypothetical protein [Planctomycetota bacterium]